jgi:hypothetical protein
VPKVSIKRKRASDERRLSTSSSEDQADIAVGLSESELSESPVLLSGSQSAGEEEPPVKRKRDKALKKASERDRLSGRSKTGRSPNKPLSSRLQSSDKYVALRSEDSAISFPAEQNQSSAVIAVSENLCADTVANKCEQENLEATINVSTNDVCNPAEKYSARLADETKEVEPAADNDSDVHKTTSENRVACHGACDGTTADCKSEEVEKGSLPGVDSENVASARSIPLSEELNDLKTVENKEEANGEVSDTGKHDAEETVQERCKSSAADEEATSSDGCSGAGSKLVDVSASDKSNTVSSDEVRIVMDCVLDALDDSRKEELDVAEAERKGETGELDRSGDTIVADSDAKTVAQPNGDVEEVEASQNDDANTTVVAKKTPLKKAGRRGRKKRGRSSKPPAAKTTDDAQVNGKARKRTGRPRKVKDEVVQEECKDEVVQEDRDSQALSEDDIPLIELRRSARANKGQRKLEQLGIERSKKRNRKEEEKERKKAEKEEKRRKREADLQQQAAMKAKKVLQDS